MTPAIIRAFWDAVDRASLNHVGNLDDETLVRWLVDRVKEQSSLDSSQQDDLNSYINNRMLLIREIATQS